MNMRGFFDVHFFVIFDNSVYSNSSYNVDYINLYRMFLNNWNELCVN